ncbi:hypothetical protein GCM10025759_17170 [Lysobacter panacisoli]|uniref:Uncharacterized protein n=1 Tax=Lysobacter panacisoli TaxID=1255263 RepID=A0ABP9LEX1_9GAMM
MGATFFDAGLRVAAGAAFFGVLSLFLLIYAWSLRSPDKAEGHIRGWRGGAGFPGALRLPGLHIGHPYRDWKSRMNEASACTPSSGIAL